MSRPGAWLRNLEVEVLTGPKEQAVEYILEHSCNIVATVQALGYPARDSLRARIYELHPRVTYACCWAI